MVDPKTAIKLLPEELLIKIYEDSASKPVQETSKIAVDFIKAARLFTAPIQLLANYQDRLEKYFDRVSNAVPEERQQQAPASLAGPIIERLKYLEEDNYLIDLYLNLLTRAIDKERVNEAHPAFFHIIDQLSPDEASLIYHLGNQTLEISLSYESNVNGVDIDLLKIVNGIDLQLNFTDNLQIYLTHLVSLNLLALDRGIKPNPKLGAISYQFHPNDRYTVSAFGKLFMRACLPENGFNFKKEF